MVNPGGTGIPKFAISAKCDPFPPRRFLIVALPSVLLPPKKYTYFFSDKSNPPLANKC